MKNLVFLLILILIVNFLISCKQKTDIPETGNLIPLAKEFVELLIKEDYSTAVTKFDNTMKSVLPSEKVQEAWQSLLTQAGPFKKQIGVRQTKEKGYDIVFVTCEFEKVNIDIKVVFDSTKQVAGLWFVPSTAR